MPGTARRDERRGARGRRGYHQAGGLRALAGPALRALFGEFGETVNLGVPRGAEVLYVDIVESEHRLRTSMGGGDVDPMRSTALGKAMLALLPDDEVRDVLAKDEPEVRTPHTEGGVDELLADLTTVRSRGYALDDEENVAGVALCRGRVARRAGPAARRGERVRAGLAHAARAGGTGG